MHNGTKHQTQIQLLVCGLYCLKTTTSIICVITLSAIGCTYNGQVFDNYATFDDENGCDECVCRSGTVVCSKNGCACKV